MIPRTIKIGYEGEQNARHIDLDISSLVDVFGEGHVVTILHKRHTDETAYPVSKLELNGNNLRWTFDAVDAAVKGYGSAQIVMTSVDGALIGKSRVIETVCSNSLTHGEEIPDGGADWAASVLADAAAIKGMRAEAETLPVGVPATAEYSGGVLRFGIPAAGEGAVLSKEAINHALGVDVPAALGELEAGKQDIISDLEAIRAGAGKGETALQEHQDISGKQDVIPDLDDIRAGAAAGATALQSFTEQDPTVPAWAKKPQKPAYSAGEISYGESTVEAELGLQKEEIANKQDAISDLDAIRDGAGKGATALQSMSIAGTTIQPNGGNVNIPIGGGLRYFGDKICTDHSSDAITDAKKDQYRAVTLDKIDRAVRAGLISNSQITDADKPIICDTVGTLFSEFQLIETIEGNFDEQTLIERQTEPDGTPYRFKNILVLVELNKGAQIFNYGQIWGYSGSAVWVRGELGNFTATDSKACGFAGNLPITTTHSALIQTRIGTVSSPVFLQTKVAIGGDVATMFTPKNIVIDRIGAIYVKGSVKLDICAIRA